MIPIKFHSSASSEGPAGVGVAVIVAVGSSLARCLLSWFCLTRTVIIAMEIRRKKIIPTSTVFFLITHLTIINQYRKVEVKEY